MDLSALIFVALAVAWAVYLIPKALRHHDEVKGSRSVDKFSDGMRVLARREPVGKREARLVVTPGRSAPAVEAVAAGSVLVAPNREEVRARRASAARAAKRRLRVVGLILLGNVVVGVLAGLLIVPWPYAGIPAAVLVAWLIACRLMVKSERRGSAPQAGLPLTVDGDVEEDEGPVTEEIAPVVADSEPERLPGSWDPVPVTLPTYVDKAPATRRTVRTIDLDSTGVWTSGRSEADSQIAREGEATERAARSERTDAEKRRAAGS
ncbi:MAG: hypothetical protein WKF79_14020 [Nocardioides sp.]